MRTTTDEDRRMSITGRVTGYLATLVASALLLAGCALVDDAHREFGSAADPQPGPRTTSPTSSPTRSPATVEPSGTPGACPPSGMLVRLGGHDAAMGLRVLGIELVNCGSVPITLNGYPEVRILDDDRALLPVTVIRGSTAVASIDNFDTPPAPVTAAPGGRLVAGLVWRNRVEAGEVVTGTYLEIVPAPGQPAQTVRPEGRIDLGTTGRLGVTAWGPPKR
jgi:hypothetical protein